MIMLRKFKGKRKGDKEKISADWQSDYKEKKIAFEMIGNARITQNGSMVASAKIISRNMNSSETQVIQHNDMKKIFIKMEVWCFIIY